MSEPQVFIVATPIGNKSDLSPRAIETLKSADVIACEDCRTSSKLLDSYNITNKLVSYHKFNEKQRTAEFLKMIEDNKKIALISDAGTPCISDPGRVLVNELFNNGVKITSIPGASAIITFLSMIPKNTEEFAFVGFLPRTKPAQQKVFEKFKDIDTVFYESPNRLIETLENIKDTLGSETKIAVGRELTKVFEEVKYGSVEEIIEFYQTNILKGEIVFVVYAKEQKAGEDNTEIEAKIKKLKELDFSDGDISRIISSLYDINKNKVYKLALKL